MSASDSEPVENEPQRGSDHSEQLPAELFEEIQNTAELERLGKQLRERQHELDSYKDQDRKKLLRDKKEIVLLERENKELRTVLDKASAECYVKRDHTTLSELRGKMSEGILVEDEIKEEKQKLEDGKVQISLMEKKMKDYRRGLSAVKRTNVKKRLSILEGRMEKANKDFGRRLEENRKLREEIGALRKDRLKFEQMYQKMTAYLSRLLKEKRKSEEQCKSTFKQREEYSTKQKNLDKREEAERNEFILEKHNLERIITQENNFRNFVNIKCKEIAYRQVEAEKERSEKEKSKRLQSARNRLDDYARAFNRLSEASKTEDVDVMIDYFVKFEAELFTDFTYIAETERQIGKLEYEITVLKEERVALEQSLTAKHDHQKEQLNELDERKRRTQQENAALEDQIDMIIGRFESIMAQAKASYKKISEKDAALLRLLEESRGQMTARNASLYLSELELRAEQMLAVTAYLNGEDCIVPGKSVPKRQIKMFFRECPRPETPSDIVGSTPDYRSEDEEENVDVKPLSRDDIIRSLEKSSQQTT